MDGHEPEGANQSTADMTVFVQNLLQQMIALADPVLMAQFSVSAQVNMCKKLHQCLHGMLLARKLERQPDFLEGEGCWHNPYTIFADAGSSNNCSEKISCPDNYLTAPLKCYTTIIEVLLDHDVLDEMGSRIDELEKSINELKAEMGVEGSPSPLSSSKVKEESREEPVSGGSA